MFRGKKPLWVIVMAIFGVVLLGGIWTYALGGLAKITNVRLTDETTPGSYIETELDGNTPINPVYNDGTGEKPMYEASSVYICRSEPFVNTDLTSPYPVISNEPCQKVKSATFGAAWNRWVTLGGTKFWVAP